MSSEQESLVASATQSKKGSLALGATACRQSLVKTGGYFTHNPYNGAPYVRGEDGRDINGHDDWTVFCVDCCPPAQAYPYALHEAWDAARVAVESAEVVARDGGMFAPLELVLACNEAGRAANAHQRYGWAPAIGAPCSQCGRKV